MKKIYIKPAMGPKCMETSSLMTASLNHVDDEQAAQGSSNDPVNLSRKGSFWEDTE